MTEEKNLSYSKQQRKQIKIIKLQQMKYLTAPREGNGNPLQYPCLENPRDRGAWWAAFYGVTQSRTWLKRLTAAGGFDIVGLISGSGRSPGGGHGNPLIFAPENSMDRGAWRATVHRDAKSWTWLKQLSTHTRTGVYILKYYSKLYVCFIVFVLIILTLGSF